MSEPEEDAPPAKPKTLIIDRKFSPGDLRLPRNQQYVKDLGQCFKIFQQWGYDIIWVANGVDAMRALREYPRAVNCVMIEAYVPGGGLTIARLIRFKPDCRHVPVFLMSSQLTRNDLVEGKKIGIFDCLARPFQDPRFLEERLSKGVEVHGEFRGKETDKRAHILGELGKITGLPAMPTVYNEIEKLSQDRETTTEQYSAVIELDPGITAQMLRLCNSSVYSFNRRVTSVKDAVNLLGLQTVVDYVRTLSVVGAFKGNPPGFDTTEFWKHAIACGVIAKLLIKRPEFKRTLNVGEDDPFMAGMVHDIGKQVLANFFNEMFQLVMDEVRVPKTMYEVEQEVLGVTHGDIGAALANRWNLPAPLPQVIGSHNSLVPEDGDNLQAMTHLVHLADVCSKRIGFGFRERPRDQMPHEATMERIEMDGEALQAVLKEVESMAREQINETFGAIFK